MADSSNDIFNMYKECEECGSCCELTVLAMTYEEAAAIQDYIDEHDIEARDQGPGICPFRGDDMRCTIYPVRTRTCRLHTCQMTRKQVEAAHPDLALSEELPLIDLRMAFIDGDLRDPRTLTAEQVIERYSG